MKKEAPKTINEESVEFDDMLQMHHLRHIGGHRPSSARENQVVLKRKRASPPNTRLGSLSAPLHRPLPRLPAPLPPTPNPGLRSSSGILREPCIP